MCNKQLMKYLTFSQPEYMEKVKTGSVSLSAAFPVRHVSQMLSTYLFFSNEFALSTPPLSCLFPPIECKLRGQGFFLFYSLLFP